MAHSQPSEGSRHEPAQTHICFFVAKPGHLRREHKIGRGKPAFLHFLGLLNPAVVAHFDFVLQGVQLSGFEHLEFVELAQFRNQHFLQPGAHRWLPVRNDRGITAERGNNEGRQSLIVSRRAKGCARQNRAADETYQSPFHMLLDLLFDVLVGIVGAADAFSNARSGNTIRC